MAIQRKITIFFNDGNHLKFSFPKQIKDSSSLSSTIHKIFSEDVLALEVEGSLYAIPRSSIKYIRISPRPEKLPDTVLHHAKLETDEY